MKRQSQNMCFFEVNSESRFANVAIFPWCVLTASTLEPKVQSIFLAALEVYCLLVNSIGVVSYKRQYFNRSKVQANDFTILRDHNVRILRFVLVYRSITIIIIYLFRLREDREATNMFCE